MLLPRLAVLLLLASSSVSAPPPQQEESGGLSDPIIFALPPATSYPHPEAFQPPPLPAAALALPLPAPRPLHVPHARTPMTTFDYSLPTMYRFVPLASASDAARGLAPELERRYKLAMHHYHFRVLATRTVARPMEVNFPPLSRVGEVNGLFRAHVAQLSLRSNAWLLSGPQIVLLNRAQFKLRRLTLFPRGDEWGDRVENSALRSHLNDILRDATNARGREVGTFPEALKQALRRVRQEQRSVEVYRSQWRFMELMERIWNANFPFLDDARIDPATHLMHY